MKHGTKATLVVAEGETFDLGKELAINATCPKDSNIQPMHFAVSRAVEVRVGRE